MLRNLSLHLLVLLLLPATVFWVWKRERSILKHGRPLTPEELKSATDRAGVCEARRIRVQILPEVPLPGWSWMHTLAGAVGCAPAAVGGMALRYGICLRTDCAHDPGILLHECVHTAQYERLGSLRAFLHRYLIECLRDGYEASSLEAEARSR